MKLVSYYPAPSGPTRESFGTAVGPGGVKLKPRALLGVVTPNGVLDVAAAAQRHGADSPLGAIKGRGVPIGNEMLDAAAFYAAGSAALDGLNSLVARATDGPFVGGIDDLDLAPVVPEPGKIICVGLNYRRHAAESGMQEPKEPILFSKYPNSLAPQGASVNIQGLTQVDYESELGVVLGRDGRDIPESEALEHVLGYFNANDVSERALQMRSSQWLLGKTLDGFLPIGPFVLTADEAGDPQDMRVRGWLNGDLRQDSSTADMIFSVAEVIAYASRFMTLTAGDIIVTGTPEGVVLGRPQKDWVVPGDEYVVEVGPLGRLVTRFV